MQVTLTPEQEEHRQRVARVYESWCTEDPKANPFRYMIEDDEPGWYLLKEANTGYANAKVVKRVRIP